MKKLLVLLLSLCAIVTLFGCTKEPEVDVNAKSEGVMTWAEFDAAEKDAPAVIECYVQGHQNWWDGAVTVYAQDKDGGYFIYKMVSSEEDAAKLVPGTKIKVTGTKTIWNGESEINAGATYEIETDATYIAEPTDVTAIIGNEAELLKKQNMVVIFKDMIVEDYAGDGKGFAYQTVPGANGDLYFKATANGVTVEFCVESYLTAEGSDVYKTVESLEVGNKIDVTAFLYWYNGANPHVTNVVIK